MTEVNLAEDLGYGVSWLVSVMVITTVVSTAFFVYVVLSTRFNHSVLRGENSLKYKLHKYHAERYWSIFVAGILAWLFFLGLPWAPNAAFHDATQSPQGIHTIGITAGQWFWKLQDLGFENDTSVAPMTPSTEGAVRGSSSLSHGSSSASASGVDASSAGPVKIKVGENVKFVAHSLDVNHGFGVLRSSKSMDAPLFQMQVVPGFDNIFYYTFKKAGTYTIRCLEYCGWNHPYMVSQITIEVA